MRTCGPGADIAIEIDVEPPIKRHAILINVNHMNFVIAFHIDDAARRQILDEKSVGADR